MRLWPISLEHAIAAPMAVLLLLACGPRGAASARILAVLTTPTRSHHLWHAPLLRGLAGRGHHVTLVSPQAVAAANVDNIVLEGALEAALHGGGGGDDAGTHLQGLAWLPASLSWYEAACRHALATPGADTLLRLVANATFDVVMVEASGGECLLGVVHLLEAASGRTAPPPVVAINGFGNPLWLSYNAGNPHHPAYVASPFLPYSHPLGWGRRVHNTLAHLYTLYYYYLHYLPAQDALAGAHFGPQAAGAAAVLAAASLVLVNTHVSVDGPRPFVPSVVPVGGMHILAPQPLPQDLQRFLDAAPEGAIFMSLGSLVRSDRLHPRRRRALLEAFRELPQRVLWKWESDTLPGRPSNVKVAKWLPQNDILAHPNVRLFVSHAGLLSTHEAVHHAVPMLGMPFMVDQFVNLERLERLGVARSLDYGTLSKDSVLQAVRDMLHNHSYRDNMKQLSQRFRDNPQPPLESALYWVEHVIRHRGAPHLRPPALPWYQYLLVDVAAVLVTALLVSLLLLSLLGLAVLRVVRRAAGWVSGKAKQH